jgi:hypothetical protein
MRGAGYADCPELVDNISANYDYWKQKLEEEQETGQRLCFSKRADRSGQNHAADKSGRLSPSGGGRQTTTDRTSRSSSVKRVPGIAEEDSASCDPP